MGAIGVRRSVEKIAPAARAGSRLRGRSIDRDVDRRDGTVVGSGTSDRDRAGRRGSGRWDGNGDRRGRRVARLPLAATRTAGSLGDGGSCDDGERNDDGSQEKPRRGRLPAFPCRSPLRGRIAPSTNGHGSSCLVAARSTSSTRRTRAIPPPREAPPAAMRCPARASGDAGPVD